MDEQEFIEEFNSDKKKKNIIILMIQRNNFICQWTLKDTIAKIIRFYKKNYSKCMKI